MSKYVYADTPVVPMSFNAVDALAALTAAAVGLVPRAAVYATLFTKLGTVSSSGAASATVKKNGTTALTLSWAATTGALTATWTDTTNGGQIVCAAGDILTADIVAGTGAKNMSFVLDA